MFRWFAGLLVIVALAAGIGYVAAGRGAPPHLTITQPAAVGFATAYPCGTPPPDASSLNYGAGQTIANLVTVKVGDGGAVCIVTSSPAQVIADVTGYYGAGGSGFASVAPARLLDSRQGGAKPIAAGTVVSVAVAGNAGVPGKGVTGASLNVTATSAAAVGFVTVYPCGVNAPNASSLNVVAGATVANGVVSATDVTGAVCVVSSVATHLTSI
jgi:hypothetical protein